MERAELAAALAAADDEERAALMGRHADALDLDLAYQINALYDAASSNQPLRAAGAAAALTALAKVAPHPEVHALAAWTAGMAALEIEGQLDAALARLNEAAAQFAALDRPVMAAATDLSRLRALAMLGRYEEALDCGLRARAVFLAHGDRLAAGKIEHNLGNIYCRRDRYREAEEFYRSARARFETAGDAKQLVLLDTCLATALIFQHKFRDAERLYEQALARAAADEMAVAQAAIECDLGCLAMFQGHYQQALDFLERSRRRYAALGMPHESAIAEQELADAYLEVNLAPEAAAIYERVTPVFADLGMRAEQARALAYHGRACLQLGRMDKARALLTEARLLYAAEGNAVGEAMVALTEAQLLYAKDYYAAAAAEAVRSEASLEQAAAWGRLLLARWLRGEAARAQGERGEARTLLETALGEAERYGVPQVMERCYTSLGLLAASAGDSRAASGCFKQAIAITEELRAPLPSEEFRAAFVADKFTPYVEMARLCLEADNVAEAFSYVERARSRALLDRLGGAFAARLKPRDPFEAELLARLETLRGELNWFYSQINRPPENPGERRPLACAQLYAEARGRESQVAEITRQLQQRHTGAPVRVQPDDVNGLPSDLGRDTALVEYFCLDGELLAFVVTDEGIKILRHLGREDQATATLEQLRFQIDSLSAGAARLRAHLSQLTRRAHHHLQTLYDMLFKPIEERLGARRVVIVPHRALHYVPFHALYDGAEYLIERREVCYAPSAAVLRQCLARPRLSLKRALLLGVADAQTPRVRDEVRQLAPLFAESAALLDGAATVAALREQAGGADVIHLACHGHFRPDNPLFSSLRLADGWLTVRDAYDLNLECGLVALSACETGVSALAPGDELLGLARGFFSAGVPSLLVSLWRVDDEATATLMVAFYRQLQKGDGPAAALRYAQRQLIANQAHPFFWSAFTLFGRW